MAGGLMLGVFATVGAELGEVERGPVPGLTPVVCAYHDFGTALRACVHANDRGMEFDEVDLGAKIGARAPIGTSPWFVGGSVSYDSAVTGPRSEGDLSFSPILAAEVGLNPESSPLNLVGGVYGGYVAIVERTPGGDGLNQYQAQLGGFVGLEAQIPLWK